MPIASFFILEVVEVVKLLEKMRSRMEFEQAAEVRDKIKELEKLI